MHSELFQLGPLHIRAFGLLLALGFLATCYAATYLSRNTHRNWDFLSALFMYMMIAGVIGARIAYILEHWRVEFSDNLGAIFRIDQGGLMFYGGVAGAAIALLIFARLKKEHFMELSDLLLTVLPLGHAFGRMGCFMHGCCHGRITSSVFGVTFPEQSPAWLLHVQNGLIDKTAACSLPVIPTQIFEASANILLFLILAKIYRSRKNEPGIISAIYLIAYGIIRFTVEHFRGDQRMAVGIFSISQAISIAAMAGGILIFVIANLKNQLNK